MRTNAHHRELGDQYRSMSAKKQKKFVQEHSTRWSELMRLPYFDMVRMFIIDPMHNLFLGTSSSFDTQGSSTLSLTNTIGLIKTHFYGIWIQEKYFRKTKELRVLHEFLAKAGLTEGALLLPTSLTSPPVPDSVSPSNASECGWRTCGRIPDFRSVASSVYCLWTSGGKQLPTSPQTPLFPFANGASSFR